MSRRARDISEECLGEWRTSRGVSRGAVAYLRNAWASEGHLEGYLCVRKDMLQADIDEANNQQTVVVFANREERRVILMLVAFSFCMHSRLSRSVVKRSKVMHDFSR